MEEIEELKRKKNEELIEYEKKVRINRLLGYDYNYDIKYDLMYMMYILYTQIHTLTHTHTARW